MNSFDLIKSKIFILDVITQYATLKKAGIYWKGRCPFHHEKTASFTVSPHKEIFYCFGCHIGGDVITFITKIEQCSPLEAVQLLAERYNITLDPKNNNEREAAEPNVKERHFTLNKLFGQWCSEQLKKHNNALNYIYKRGISSLSINAFSLGYLPSGPSTIKSCIEMFRTHHFLVNDLIDAHILTRGKSTLYSPFEDRIIFPIKDTMGRFCGFGGRVFKPDDTRPKYYNSRENDFFIKGSLLFGLDQAKKNIQSSGTAILVEGYIDCIAMAEHGFPNTIATLGTACTIHHLKIISRYADSLLVLYDGDQAGKNAVFRLADLCWQTNMELKIASLPNGFDPASFLEMGHSLAPLIEQAQEIISFFIDAYGNGFTNQSLNKKLELLRALLILIANVKEPLKQDILIQRTALAVNMPFEIIKREVTVVQKVSHSQPIKTQSLPIPSPKNSSTLEQRLFCAIVNNPEVLSHKNESYIIDYIKEPLRAILMKVVTFYKDNKKTDFSSIFAQLEGDEQHLVSKIITEHDEKMTIEQFNSLIYQLQKQEWRSFVKIMQKRLINASNQQEMKSLLDQFMRLKQELILGQDDQQAA